MNALLEKEKELINKPIIDFIVKYLLNGFKNGKDRVVKEVNNNLLLDFEIDEDKSEIKDIIIINKVTITAKVWVEFPTDALTNDTIILKVNTSIILPYNFENKEYVIANLDELKLTDMST